ncbi:MAG: 2-C-methyl-D-erythritol 4-phosphate cytidylyltransferase [Endomicrobiaceae bacterium]|nr:2-C-methyl-D-erythritol 4-phosphate cytidylyltransferase [Endomicrobiaceae bacterium]
MNLAAIIVAGGSGKRFGSKQPKQFLFLNKKPMFLWSILAFKKAKGCKQIILVVPKDKISEITKYNKLYNIDIVCGGKERFNSVKNGLDIVRDDIDIVAVHDAARPLITEKIINEVMLAAEKSGGAIAATNSKDSVKLSKNGKTITTSIDRKNIWQAQTPQIFKKDILKKVYSKKISLYTTDDSQLVEKIGKKIALVSSSYENFKVTEPLDFKLAEFILKKRNTKCL